MQKALTGDTVANTVNEQIGAFVAKMCDSLTKPFNQKECLQQDYQCQPATALMTYEILMEGFVNILRVVHGSCKTGGAKLLFSDLIRDEVGSTEFAIPSHSALFRAIPAALREKSSSGQRSCNLNAREVYGAISRLLGVIENDSRAGIVAAHAINSLYAGGIQPYLKSCCEVFGIEFDKMQYSQAHHEISEHSSAQMMDCFMEEFTGKEADTANPFTENKLAEVLAAVEHLMLVALDITQEKTATA